MRARGIIFLTVLVLSALLLQCETNPTHAAIGDTGGGGGIETQAVRGQILDSTGVPAPSVGVTARSADDVYLSGANGAVESYVAHTNPQGGFAFGGLPLGTYLFEAFIDSGHGVVFYDDLDGSDEELWVGAKRASGTVALHLMVLPIPGIDSSTMLKASILGLDKHTSALPSEPLRFSNLPPTVYTVRIGSSRPSYTGTADISVEVRGDTAVTIVKGVGLPVHYREDSLAVSTFLNEQGMKVDDQNVLTKRWNNRIRSLDLRNREITSVVSSIGTLSFLQSLDLGANPLMDLPSEIAELDELHYLALDSTNMEFLPGVVCSLTGLRELNIGHTRIGGLPENIGRLQRLTALSMRNNNLLEVPSGIFSLSTLQYLDMSGNRISSIPAEIERLHSLHTLELSDNELSLLPDELTGCILLEKLCVERNLLTTLPANLPFLTRLRVLRVGENELAELPAEFGRLTALTHLDLAGNALSLLPSSMVNINRLAELDVAGNELCDIAGSIVHWLNLNDPDWDEGQECD